MLFIGCTQKFIPAESKSLISWSFGERFPQAYVISRSMKSCVGMFMKMDLVRVALGVDLMVREVGDKIQLSRIAGLLEH